MLSKSIRNANNFQINKSKRFQFTLDKHNPGYYGLWFTLSNTYLLNSYTKLYYFYILHISETVEFPSSSQIKHPQNYHKVRPIEFEYIYYMNFNTKSIHFFQASLYL